jgi:dTDP-4-amino-4,6-dideoxygalactose transaminase
MILDRLEIMENNDRLIPLFYPFIAESAYESLKNVLNSKWIGQGPLVDDFENLFLRLEERYKKEGKD